MYTKEQAIKRIVEDIDDLSHWNYDRRFNRDDICAVLKCFADHDCDYVEYENSRHYLDLNRGDLVIDRSPFYTFNTIPYLTPVPRKKVGKVQNSVQFRSLL